MRDRVAPVVRARRALTNLEVLAVVAVLVPIAVAIARKWHQHWVPIGDNALIEIRSRDVFSMDHFPFLGTWSSASLSAGKDLNHPGPLLFDLLALPVKLFGGPRGVALGVGLINAAAVIGVAVVGHRVRGRLGALAATLAAALLAWTLGGSMLTDPWNPHVLVLPCLLFLVLVWGLSSGHLELLPWLLAVGSLCVQTHLGYSYLVPTMTLVGIAGAVAVHRHRWRVHPVARDDEIAIIRRWGWRSLAVLAVLWAQPLLEQLFGPGEGNLSRIVSSAGGDEPTIGGRIGARIAASVLALPPWWGRSSFTGAVQYTPYGADGVTITPAGLPGFAAAVLALMVLVGVLVAGGVLAWRRRDRPGACATAVAIVAVMAALVSLTIMPIGPLGLTPHQMRWLWSIGAFVLFALVVAGVDALGERRSIPAGLLAMVVLVSVCNVPGFTQLAGPDTFQESIPVGRALAEQVASYHTHQSVLFDTSNLRYLEPYSAVVMAALQEGDVDLRVSEEGLVRQLGEARRTNGREPLTVYILEGMAALGTPEGSERIAFTSPLDPITVDQLLAGERAMVDSFAVDGVFFTAAGEQAITANEFGLTRDQIVEASLDAETFVSSGLAAELIAAGALDLPEADAAVFEHISSLRRQVGTTTVAVLIRST